MQNGPLVMSDPSAFDRPFRNYAARRVEPLLISVMGLIVGVVVMSVFLPILDVVGKLGSK